MSTLLQEMYHHLRFLHALHDLVFLVQKFLRCFSPHSSLRLLADSPLRYLTKENLHVGIALSLTPRTDLVLLLAHALRCLRSYLKHRPNVQLKAPAGSGTRKLVYLEVGSTPGRSSFCHPLRLWIRLAVLPHVWGAFLYHHRLYLLPGKVLLQLKWMVSRRETRFPAVLRLCSPLHPVHRILLLLCSHDQFLLFLRHRCPTITILR